MTTVRDRLTLSDMSMTPEGFLVATATIARTGIQTYRAFELGLKDDADPMREIRVFRPDSEVFEAESMASFARKPVTDDHPADLVTSQNARQLTRGFTGDQVTRDNDLLRTSITITDREMIEAVQGGKRETSNGYEADIEFTDGTTPDGEAFDAIMRNIRGNHVAIVDAGRCGPSCRIGDNGECQCPECTGASGQNGAEKVTDKITLRSITVDGFTFDATEQAAQAIDKLQRQVADGQTANEALQTKLDDAVKAHDKALGEKDAEIKRLTDAQIKPDDLDKLVADRQAFADDVKRLDDTIDIKGKSVADVRREVVGKLTDADMTDKSDDYVEGLFAGLVADADDPDPLRQAIQSGPSKVRDVRNDAYNKRVNDMSNAWKGNKGAASQQEAN